MMPFLQDYQARDIVDFVLRHYKPSFSALEAEEKEQKLAEWSEEDFEKLVGDLVQDVVANEKDANNYGDSKKPTHFYVKKYIERFKSLCPQPKAEWSEEDEIKLKLCEDSFRVPQTRQHLIQQGLTPGDMVSWLKSLRPSWKPSKEQIYSLGTVDDIIIEKAVLTFGVDPQIDMAIEECAELINALMKYRRHRVKEQEVITEIADVQIMCAQLEFIFSADKGKVDAERRFKMKRLNERIESRRKKPDFRILAEKFG